LYRAPQLPGTYHLVAASAADPSRTAAAVITVPEQTVNVSVAPVAVTLSAGAQMRFTAAVSGSLETRVYWSCDGGSIAQDGTYTAPAAEGTYRVTAQAFADPGRSADASVAVVAAGGAVRIDPLQATVHVGDSVQFHAQVSSGSVAWSVQERDGGSIDASGLYRSPADHEGVFHIVAADAANPSSSATATVTVSWFDLIDHGGPVVPATRTFALWWGNPASLPADARATAESLLASLGGSDYLAVADQYLRGARAATTFAGSLFDASSPPIKDDPAAVEREACAALTASGQTPRAGDVVLVYGASPLQTPTYCAWHWYAGCGSVTLLVVWIPNPSGTACAAASRGCNSQSDAANGVATATAHELIESMTDPYGGTWLDANGEEVADKCIGDLGCVTLGAATFQLQSEYSNALHACAFR
jgi:plastocyanin